MKVEKWRLQYYCLRTSPTEGMSIYSNGDLSAITVDEYKNLTHAIPSMETVKRIIQFDTEEIVWLESSV